jgi:catechol 2,3-dioxygenase-like lactoylglutathione lyase family enzyme
MAATWTLQRAAAILPVRDVRASLARYEKLGFTPRIYGDPSADERLIYGFLHRDEGDLHLALTDNLDPHENQSAVYLYVDDPDALFRQWSEAGVDGSLNPPADRDWGMREMTYVDPDGNLLRIGRLLQRSGT